MKKAVFVTGAASGTGLAIARRFSNDGYGVFITSRSKASAEEAAAKLGAETGGFVKGFELGIGNEEKVKAVFAEIDSLGYFVESLILNAANLGFGSDPAKGLDPLDSPMEEFTSVFETNLFWNFMIVRQAALRMRENKGGAIVFISSNTAYRAIPNRTAYCASKGGINSMSRALAVDLGKYGIRSNVVLPGTIKTERWKKMAANQIVSGSLCPIGDISDYEDIANAAYYLGSPLSKNVTGAEIPVDGGMSCQLYPQMLNVLAREKAEWEKNK